MLEKPDLQDEKIRTCLQDEYHLPVIQITFLPIGADLNIAVYRSIAKDGTAYFVKLRSGIFNEIVVTLPKFLSDLGIQQIITPLATRTEQLWANLETFKLILYPFVEGHNGYEVNLSDRHWRDFGTSLKRIHTAILPPALKQGIEQETYNPRWRETVKRFMGQVKEGIYSDAVAEKLAAYVRVKKAEILDLVMRTERLALILQTRPPEYILCHSDIHAGNILIGNNDNIYIVDWDNPILAPKERDLMFIGGGQGFTGHTAQEEETFFYQGYGQTQIDPVALAYYRYERIIVDIAIFCEQIFLTTEGGEDREQAFRYLVSNFQPGNTIEIARKSDKT
jgi:spectinomycin phosphotransferase